jgi:hypothetical protein
MMKPGRCARFLFGETMPAKAALFLMAGWIREM